MGSPANGADEPTVVGGKADRSRHIAASSARCPGALPDLQAGDGAPLANHVGRP